jgi:glycosyltransferase involved in cell wall biosynthesis
MKVLYAALRHDPSDPVASSSVDFGFFSAISQVAESVEVFGPFRGEAPLWERIFKRTYRGVTGARYIKWDLSTIIRSSILLNRTVHRVCPDVVFTIFPASLAFYRGRAPVVFCTDLTFRAWQEHGAGFGRMALRFLVWLERQAVQRCSLVIVHSAWGKEEIVRSNGVQREKIRLIVMPAAIPSEAVPAEIHVRTYKQLEKPIRLLLVGRDYHRKGVDLALDAVRDLNEMGCDAELTVCGVRGPRVKHAHFVGPYRKDVASELAAYLDLYRSAHFLLHPARFEPAGIVPSEAAAFGTPTITNDTGGLATTVKDGVSGVVLPKGSPAVAYARAIRDIVENPDRYYRLCRTTRERYERELNWDIAGKQVASILLEAVSSRPSSSNRVS